MRAKQIRRKKKHQAKNMKILSNTKCPGSIGDTVIVKILDVDRGRGDFRNIRQLLTDQFFGNFKILSSYCKSSFTAPRSQI